MSLQKKKATNKSPHRKKKINKEKQTIDNKKKNIISFSLWGELPFYWVGALHNIDLAKEHYPNWICRFYVDDNVSRDRIEALRKDNTEVVLKRRDHDFDGALWRFLAACDPNAEYVLFRDCDSRIGPREASAVNSWMMSDKEFHVMRDHPWHRTEILAGMWGCRAGGFPNLDTMMLSWNRFDHKGVDQEFLTEIVYPLMSGRVLEHSEFGIVYNNPTEPFPSTRNDFEFVGEIFDENDRRNDDHRRVLIEALDI